MIIIQWVMLYAPIIPKSYITNLPTEPALKFGRNLMREQILQKPAAFLFAPTIKGNRMRCIDK
jgi:hypothetical protein